MRCIKLNEFALCVILIGYVVLACGAQATADDLLLAEAIEGNSRAIDGIRSLYAKVHRKLISPTDPNEFLEFSGEYWREPGLVRVRQISLRPGEPGRKIEFSEGAGIQRTVFENVVKDGKVMSLLIAPEATPTIDTDVWKLALLGLPPFDSEPRLAISLGDAVKSMKVTAVVREAETVRISLNDVGETYDVWVDPQVNWLISRIVRRIKGVDRESDERRNEYWIPGFVEVSPAVFFPTAMEFTGYVDEKVSVKNSVVFDSVEINTRQLSPFPLSLPIENGTQVTDNVKKKAYTIDAEGNQIGSAKTIGEHSDLGSAFRCSPVSRRLPWYLPTSLLILAAITCLLYCWWYARTVKHHKGDKGKDQKEAD